MGEKILTTISKNIIVLKKQQQFLECHEKNDISEFQSNAGEQ